MRKRSYGILLGALALLLVLAAGCSGGSSPATEPGTATPVQATAVPVQATATPVPPTATVTAPSAAPAATSSTSTGGGFLSQAVAKFQGVSIYRVEITVSGAGAFVSPGSQETPTAGGNQQTIVSVKGDVNGKDTHMTLSGVFTAMLGLNPGQSLEVITKGDQAYVHGPVPLLGATDNQWYQLPASEAAAAKPPLTPNTFLQSLNATGLQASDVSKTGTETLDNASCDVYLANKDAVVNAFNSIGGPGAGATLSVIDSAELKFWVCGDGILHQARMSITGHTKDNPPQQGSFQVLMHIYDINANIQIQAPANAPLLPTPSFASPPTPTP